MESRKYKSVAQFCDDLEAEYGDWPMEGAYWARCTKCQVELPWATREALEVWSANHQCEGRARHATV